ncbi:potassium channel family protein [uncultured Polaribacter sp.]|uniref:potassium channel family protein n=1 Tax=uncultured Polaribacter sp. TaxID=174711 RepID=UPI00259B1ABF|nr:potassium channel family protein [uncultured Polaribacter sp.]
MLSKQLINVTSVLQKGALLYVFAFSFLNILAQEEPNQLKKYSHSQFFELLTSTQEDAVFSLKNAFIYIDEEQDSEFYYELKNGLFSFSNKDTITIKPKIELENVHFEHIFEDYGFALHHLKFEKPVVIENTASIVFSNCVFKQGVYIDVNKPLDPYITYFENTFENYGNDIAINESIIKKEFIIDVGTIEVFSPIFTTISNSILHINANAESNFYINNIRAFDFLNNTCKGESFINFSVDESWRSQILFNDFGEVNVVLYQAGISSSSVNMISDNIFRKTLVLEVENFNKTDVYNWKDWEGKMISYQGYASYVTHLHRDKEFQSFSTQELFNNDSIIQKYIHNGGYELENAFKYEKRLTGSFYDFYKSQYDTDFANKTYVRLKDLETKRYEYLHEQNPSFKTFFTWKINNFLKVFSAYGTDPSKSIIISIYVILVFAFIYLFFPNSWDTINKNRLMKRIRFYTRYFRNNEGMKEIYSEENKEELMSFSEFKEYMNQSKKETPSYFLWLAKPIYYFSATNYKIISKVFDKIDILKGRWVDLPQKRKIIASILMGFWMFFILFIDLVIKFLNALTLSINTFTTLGFGEIPTKGIPRYLCVIQGFIGWFMLSIFSVALISQLLN